MALIKCSECGNEISDKAAVCIHCGCPLDQIQAPTTEKENSTPKKKSKKLFLNISIVVACILLVVAAVGLIFNRPALPFSENAAAIERADASVVTIFCYDYDGQLATTGSGFIAFNNKTVITNYHVIESAFTCKISTNKDISFDVSSVLAYSKEHDIAIVELSKETELKPLTLGSSNNIKKGEAVVAIGSPLGIKNVVSQGVLSGRVAEGGIEALQFTAAISSGSSGGALFDNNGNVIGITFASYIDGQNLNLAIPIELANELYNSNPSAISFDEFYHSRYSPMRQKLANWIITNGEPIGYTLIAEDTPHNGYYVYYYNTTHHYWLEYHQDTNSIRITSQSYRGGVIFPNRYSVTLSASGCVATYSAYDIDGYETAEILVAAKGEFDISQFTQNTTLYCTEYDWYSEYFGYGKPYYEFEPIFRAEICGSLDWLIWLLAEESVGVTIADLGFTSY